jgi:hypothetical protein
MTAQEIATILPSILGGLFVAGLALLLLALFHLRRGRSGPYWRLRRQASMLGFRLLLAALGIFGLTIALAFYSGLATLAFRGLDDLFTGRAAGAVGVVVPTLTVTVPAAPTFPPTPTQPPTRVPTSAAATPTLTETAVPTLTATPTLTPTLTGTPTLTLTPSPTYEAVLNLAAPSALVTARPGALVEVTAADDAISANQTPLQPRAVFAAGTDRLYFFISYRNMTDGAAWSRVLYRDGVPVQGQAYLWSMGAEGASFFFFGSADGYAPGSYEVRMFLGEREVSRFPFVVSADQS